MQPGRSSAQASRPCLLSGWRWLRALSKRGLRGGRVLRPPHWPGSRLSAAPRRITGSKEHSNTDEAFGSFRECTDVLY